MPTLPLLKSFSQSAREVRILFRVTQDKVQKGCPLREFSSLLSLPTSGENEQQAEKSRRFAQDAVFVFPWYAASKFNLSFVRCRRLDIGMEEWSWFTAMGRWGWALLVLLGLWGTDESRGEIGCMFLGYPDLEYDGKDRTDALTEKTFNRTVFADGAKSIVFFNDIEADDDEHDQFECFLQLSGQVLERRGYKTYVVNTTKEIRLRKQEGYAYFLLLLLSSYSIHPPLSLRFYLNIHAFAVGPGNGGSGSGE